MPASLHAPLRFVALAAVGLLALACGPEIGDECSGNAECGVGRTCDLSSKDGYCTIGGCTANSCPDNSVCVTFRNTESYCMAICDSDEDCRDGYVCDPETGAHPYCRVRSECRAEDAADVFLECVDE